MTNTVQNVENGFEGDLIIFNPAKMAKEGISGEIITGTYVGYFEEKREVKSTGKPFISKSHRFKDEGGNTVILNSSGLFDFLVKKKNVVSGDSVRVIYGGKDSKDMHKFDLIVDNE